MSPSPRSFAGAIRAFLSGNDPKYREPSVPAIIRLFVFVCLFYGIGAALITYWPAWQKGSQAYFRRFGDAAFEQFLLWPHASAHFLDLNAPGLIDNIRAKAPPLTLPSSFPVPHRDKVMDTLILLKNVDPNRPGLGQFRTSSRLMAYWPLLTMMSCALATPWPLRRRFWLLLWCFLLAHAFILFRLAVLLLGAGFADPKKTYRLFDMSPWWFDRLKQFDSVLNDNPTVGFMVAVFLWLLVVGAMELWLIVWARIKAALGTSRTSRRRRRL